MSDVDCVSRERLARRLLAVMLAEVQREDCADENFRALMKMPVADFWLDLADDVKARITHELESARPGALGPKKANVLVFRKPG